MPFSAYTGNGFLKGVQCIYRVFEHGIPRAGHLGEDIKLFESLFVERDTSFDALRRNMILVFNTQYRIEEVARTFKFKRFGLTSVAPCIAMRGK